MPEMFRTITRAVLLEQTKAVRSMNRVELTGDACAISPCRDPVAITSVSAVAPLASEGKSQANFARNPRVPTGNERQL